MLKLSAFQLGKSNKFAKTLTKNALPLDFQSKLDYSDYSVESIDYGESQNYIKNAKNSFKQVTSSANNTDTTSEETPRTNKHERNHYTTGSFGSRQYKEKLKSYEKYFVNPLEIKKPPAFIPVPFSPKSNKILNIDRKTIKLFSKKSQPKEIVIDGLDIGHEYAKADIMVGAYTKPLVGQIVPQNQDTSAVQEGLAKLENEIPISTEDDSDEKILKLTATLKKAFLTEAPVKTDLDETLKKSKNTTFPINLDGILNTANFFKEKGHNRIKVILPDETFLIENLPNSYTKFVEACSIEKIEIQHLKNDSKLEYELEMLSLSKNMNSVLVSNNYFSAIANNIDFLDNETSSFYAMKVSHIEKKHVLRYIFVEHVFIPALDKTLFQNGKDLSEFMYQREKLKAHSSEYSSEFEDYI